MIWTHGLINRFVMMCDSLMIVAGVIIMHFMHPFGSFLHLGLYAIFHVIIYTWIMNVGSAYRLEHYLSFPRQLRQVTVGVALTGLMMGVIDGALLAHNSASWARIISQIVLIWAMIMSGRLILVRAFLWWADHHALLVRKVVIVGTPAEITRVMTHMQQAQQKLHQIVGIFLLTLPDDEIKSDINLNSLGIPVLGTSDDLIAYMRQTPADMVFLAIPWCHATIAGDFIEKLGRFSIDVFVPLEESVFNPHFAQVTTVSGIGVLQVIRRPLKGTLNLIKMVEDYVVATIGMIVVAPILLISAIAIRLETPGPIMFRQTRVGYNDKPFEVLKLRTMIYDPTDDGSLGTLRDDPRITRVGAVLRKLSIDELPQLINVLRGEMSVVGPRPHVPNMQVGDIGRYDTIRAYAHRYQMKPGITGWAQISGMRGGIHTPERAIRGVNLDLYYIENWSLWLDIKIMLLTVTKGMAGDDIF